MRPHAGRIAGSPAILDANTVTLFPPQPLEAVPECGEARWRLRVAFGEPHQHANSPHAFARLRACRQRPCRSGAAEQRDELPPSHSITSSARRRNDSGILRSIAFAVFKLITSSNLVGSSTGR